MEQPLTPPPSFRVLRVRTRTRTTSDENSCRQASMKSDTPTVVAFPRADPSSSPSRGRTRGRGPRPGLTQNVDIGPASAKTRPSLSLTLPPCCSPSPSRPSSRTSTTATDEELIFRMSPVLPQSPTQVFFESTDDARADSRWTGASSMQALSALYELQNGFGARQQPKPDVHFEAFRTHARKRTGTLTQHRRGHSDVLVGKQGRDAKRGPGDVKTRHGHAAHQQHQRSADHGVNTLLDLSPLLLTPLTPATPSSPDEEPFLYNFPRFESSPLLKARQARARRERERAQRLGPSSETLEVEEDVKMRTRRPRVEVAEPNAQFDDEDDDANFISHAFRSASLDPEKIYVDDDVEESEYFSSQPCSSSVSSSSLTDNSSLKLSGSLLASFPRAPAYDHTQTQTPSLSRSHSHRLSPLEGRGLSLSGRAISVSDAEKSALMNRGRASVARVRRAQESDYFGGDRCARGGTPAP